jgi:signal recognition particle subunit SRP54
MGDIVSLVEQAQRKFDQQEMLDQQERLAKGQFTLEDFRKMIGQMGKLGPLEKVMSLLPGMGGLGAMSEMMKNADTAGEMRRMTGIIDAMTPDERRNPSRIVDQSRRRRIAAGAGVEPHEVNQLVKQFDGMADMMKKMAGMGIRQRLQAAQQLSQTMASNPNAMLVRQKKGTGKRLTSEERNRIKKERERMLRKKRRDDKKKRDDGNT